ncbi:MAG: SAF domain-containing protein [Propionicimonas sp.]|uniref:SAF domain-containing protein n=1 Tax=Propionicimonas sp. TaxID=1955623 RepID=UPI003D0BC7FB
MAVVSAALVVFGGMFGVGVWTLATSSVEVVAARLAIDRGAVITADDLAVTRVTVDPSVPVVPAADLAGLVGKRAASDVAAGTLLSPAEVTDALPPATGDSVVGVALATGQLPAEPLRPGDRVRLVQTPQAQGEVPATQVTIDAQVQSVVQAADGQTTVVDLLVPSTRAAEVAARAATGRVALVLDSRER